MTITLTLTLSTFDAATEGPIEITGVPVTPRGVTDLVNSLSFSGYGITDLPTLPHLSALLYPASSVITLTHEGKTGRTNVLATEVSAPASITITGSYLA